MLSNKILLADMVLIVIAMALSTVAVYYYSKGSKKFLSGEFKSYAFWMLLGVVIYTIHLMLHFIEEANLIGWVKVNEAVVSLATYAFLAIAGAFFLIGSYFYLKLSGSIGYKR